MLHIEDLTISVEGKVILNDFTLHISKGEVHVLLGPNGAGKTTLIKAILGYKNYKVENGTIIFKGEDITNLPTHERVRKGIGVLFQHPPAINGVKLKQLLRVCGRKQGKFSNDNDSEEPYCEEDISEDLLTLAKKMNFDKEHLDRDVNVGFSGGEIKRSEILQMMVMEPDFLLFDEPDSGVDVENVEVIAEVMRTLLDRDKIPAKQERSGLIITHLGYILKFLGHITRAHVLINGSIRCSGDPTQIIQTIMRDGFKACANCAMANLKLSEEVCIDE